MALSRRGMLKALGWSVAGLTIVAGGAYGFGVIPALPYRKAPTEADASAWLRLRPDGVIEVQMPRSEIGQGIAVSFRQIVAEETGFPLERIVAVHPRTDRLPPARATVGSDSVKDFGPLLAKAAVALAVVLRQAGSENGRPPKDGWQGIAGRSQLIDARSVAGGNPASFSRSATRRVVGKGYPTDQIQAIVTGKGALYADDVRLPGMAFCSMLRAPRLGAQLVSVDDKAARSVAGYLGLHVADGTTFVAAESRGALERSAAALKANWQGGDVTQDAMLAAIDIDSGLAGGGLEHVLVADKISPGSFDLDMRLDVPFAAHACMEPQTAVARFDGERLEVWAGTQDVTFVRAHLAKALGLDATLITVHGCRVGGGFGLKAVCLVEFEAAICARVLKRPVKVQWTRLEAFRQSYHRPPSSHRIRVRLSADGTIDAWHHAFRSGHVLFTSAAMGPVLQFATSFVGDPGVLRDAIPPYAIQKSRVEFEDVRLPVHTGPWRGLGAAPNTWAIETAIDALARLRGEDPVQFRKRQIAADKPRLARALEQVAASSHWSSRKSTNSVGYGVACGIYKDMSYVAVVAEVRRSGKDLRVSKLWCAHDCGMLINPDQVKAQVEGNLVWGIGMALSEQLAVADGHVNVTSFADYLTPRFSEVPELAIDLIDEGDQPTGAGETALVAATAAITNAVAAMTGASVRRLPVRLLDA
jgi:isoquinoline 1-oxidoreductase beta subunit